MNKIISFIFFKEDNTLDWNSITFFSCVAGVISLQAWCLFNYPWTFDGLKFIGGLL